MAVALGGVRKPAPTRNPDLRNNAQAGRTTTIPNPYGQIPGSDKMWADEVYRGEEARRKAATITGNNLGPGPVSTVGGDPDLLSAILAGLNGGGSGGGGGGGGGFGASPSLVDQQKLAGLEMMSIFNNAAANNSIFGFLDKEGAIDQGSYDNAIKYLDQLLGFAGESRDLKLKGVDVDEATKKNTSARELDQFNSEATASGAYGAAGFGRDRGYMAEDLAQALLGFGNQRSGIGLDYRSTEADIGNKKLGAKEGLDRSNLDRAQKRIEAEFRQKGYLLEGETSRTKNAYLNTPAAQAQEAARAALSPGKAKPKKYKPPSGARTVVKSKQYTP